MSAAAALTAMAPGSYYDSVLQTEAIKLLPADYVVTDRPIALVTLLGSCVAACLYDPIAGLGGMNHFMLPGHQAEGQDDTSARYGMNAMELLINDLLKRGARRQRLMAKVFGGGNVLRGFYADPIGTRNARFVLEYLRAEGIPVAAQDLGENQARKVCFFAQGGRALVRRLPATRDDAIVDTERAYYGRLTHVPVSGGVELF